MICPQCNGEGSTASRTNSNHGHRCRKCNGSGEVSTCPECGCDLDDEDQCAACLANEDDPREDR